MTSAFHRVQRQQIERHLNWRGLHITVVKQESGSVNLWSGEGDGIVRRAGERDPGQDL